MPDPVISTLSAAGQSTPWLTGAGRFNIFITGTFTGLSAVLERKPRETSETAWAPCTQAGSAVVFDTTASEVIYEPEPNIEYRLNVTAIASGTVRVRFSA